MSADRGILSLAVICLVIILLSLAGIVTAFFTDLIWPQPTLDGLLLVLVCLMMGGIFSLMLFQIAKGAGWLERLRARRRKAAAPAAAAASNVAGGAGKK